MSYIGTPPSNAFTSLLKQDFSTSATTGYTLDHAVNNANDIALFINFVRQEPTAGYAASGTSLVLTSATASSDDMYCVYLGQALQTVNPANASVGISQLSATGTKDATTFLRGDNTFLKVPFATKDYDTDSAYDSTTNYRFTVPSSKAGKYFVNAFLRANYNCALNIAIYKNGSLTYVSDAGTNGSGATAVSPQITTTMNLLVSDYIEIYAFQQSGGSLTFDNNSGIYPWFEMYKLIGA